MSGFSSLRLTALVSLLRHLIETDIITVFDTLETPILTVLILFEYDAEKTHPPLPQAEYDDQNGT